MITRKLAAIFALGMALALMAAAGAQAAPVRWWVTPPTGELTPGTPLTVASEAKLVVTEGTGAIGKCVFKDVEVVENPLSAALSGVDSMTVFAGVCKNYPWPCVKPETASAKGIGLPWPSVLTEPSVGVYGDAFSGVAIEFSCSGSGLSAIYTATHFEPQVLVNNLKFTLANNVLKSGIHEIRFVGNDKLFPTAGYTKIKAK